MLIQLDLSVYNVRRTRLLDGSYTLRVYVAELIGFVDLRDCYPNEDGDGWFALAL